MPAKTDDLDQMDEVLDLVPGQRQLFVDELNVETKWGIVTQFHQAQKKGAVIRPYGFENMTGSCQTRSMPQWNPLKKQFELPVLGGDPASQVHNPNGQSNPQWFVSKDGIQWTFGAISRPPYIWEPPYQYLIDSTGEANASRMYKTIIPCVGGNVPVCGAHTSSDGINWTAVPGAAKIATSDEQNLSFDSETGEFIYSVKRFANGRAVAIATTTDFYASQWTDLGIVFQADEEDQRLGKLEIEARLNDSSLKQPFGVPKSSVFHVDVYNMGVFRYESVYMGLPAMYHAVAPSGSNTLGFHLIKAVTSRDLKNWTWLGNRSTFISPSKVDSGAYDLMQMLPPSNVLIRGDLLWMYYSCMKSRTGSANAPLAWHLDNPDNGAICLATIRRDGFVSLVGGNAGGTVETSQFRAPTVEQRLCVNADAGAAGGELRAELLDASGKVLSLATVYGDATRHTLTFVDGNGAALDRGGELVRLRFILSPGVHLYSYWVEFDRSSIKGDDEETFSGVSSPPRSDSTVNSCQSDLDCSLNGVCGNATCYCDSGWSGVRCHLLDFAPSEHHTAYDVDGNTSSWGGSAALDPADGKWHGFFSEFAGHCGVNSWLTNSMIVHAVSEQPQGPYIRQDVALGAWAHEAEGHRDPSSGEWLLWHVGLGSKNGRGKQCLNGSSASAGQPAQAWPTASNNLTKAGGVFHHASSPAGPWLPFELTLPLRATHLDSGHDLCVDNPSMHLTANGTAFVLGLCDDTPVMHVWRADKWNGTYELLGTINRGSTKNQHPAWSWVDPYIWLDRRGNLHVLACMGIEPLWQVTYGAHVYSGDGGRTWHSLCYDKMEPSCASYSNGTTNFVDGSQKQIKFERPKLMLDPVTGSPLVLFNSAGYHGKGITNDRSYTVARPIRQRSVAPMSSDIFVSPDGSDTNGDGTRIKPFATLNAAQLQARTVLRKRPLKRDVVVHVAPGVYHQREALHLSEEDAGRDGFRMKYQGPGPRAGTDPSVAAIVHGGVQVGGLAWSRTSAGSPVWVADVTSLAPPPPLSSRGARAPPPVPNVSYPNCGSVLVGFSIDGHDLVPNGTLLAGSIDACCKACGARADCKGFSFCNVPKGTHCWYGHNRSDHIDCYLKTVANGSGSGPMAARVSGTPGAGCFPNYHPLPAPSPKPPPSPQPGPPAPSPYSGWRFFNLLEAREPAVLARLPDLGSGYLKDLGCTNTNLDFTCPPGVLPRGLSADDSSVFTNVGANWFSQIRAGVAVNNPPTKFTFAGSRSQYNANERIFLQGDKSLISEEGEWALEHKTGRLYYWPRNQSAMEAGISDIVAATTVRVFDIRGSGWEPEERASAIDISGLVLSGSDFSADYDLCVCNAKTDFKHCRTNDTPEEYREGMVRIANASDIRVTDSALLDAGFSAFWLQGMALNVSIIGNRVERPGFCGVYAQGIYPGDTTAASTGEIAGGAINSIEKSDVNKGHTILSNFFGDVGRRVGHGAGVWLFQSGRSRISHNHISEGPRDGIGIYGNRQGSMPSEVYGQAVDFWTGLSVLHTRFIEVDHNLIENVVRDTSDAGAIEWWGTGAWNTAHHNCLSDMDPGILSGDWMNFFFMDDAVHSTVIYL